MEIDFKSISSELEKRCSKISIPKSSKKSGAFGDLIGKAEGLQKASLKLGEQVTKHLNDILNERGIDFSTEADKDKFLRKMESTILSIQQDLTDRYMNQ